MSPEPLSTPLPQTALLTHLLNTLQALPAALPSPTPVSTWWRQVLTEVSALSASVDRAILAGILSPHPAFAYAGGLQAALRALVPSLPLETLVALCITEAGGGHPKAIQSRLEPTEGGWYLSGSKRFITLGIEAQALLVVASLGWQEGQNLLRVVKVPLPTAGVTLTPMPTLPVVPEVSHATLELHQVLVPADALLPGDGYLNYIKPFRTLEDIHVHAGLMGYLLNLAFRFEWPREVKEELLAVTLMLRGLGLEDPTHPALHLALTGFFAVQERCLEGLSLPISTLPEAERERWQRDLGLRMIAAKARALRTEAAWRSLTPSPPR